MIVQNGKESTFLSTSLSKSITATLSMQFGLHVSTLETYPTSKS